jgi:flavorubredoxin
MSSAVSDAFRYSKLVLATTTYNGSMYPFMHDFIHRLVEHRFQKRTVALIENGSWAPSAGRVMREQLSAMKEIELVEPTVTLRSRMKDSDLVALEALADAILA